MRMIVAPPETQTHREDNKKSSRLPRQGSQWMANMITFEMKSLSISFVSREMNRFLALFLFPLISFGATSQSLFNGKNLDDWEPRGQAIFEVQDGVIYGHTGKGGHGWLCS